MAKTADDLQKEIDKLKARQRELKKRERAENAKREARAEKVLMGMVKGYFPNGWTEIGFGKFAKFLERNADELRACAVENLEPKDAEQRLRDWQKKKASRSE